MWWRLPCRPPGEAREQAELPVLVVLRVRHAAVFCMNWCCCKRLFEA